MNAEAYKSNSERAVVYVRTGRDGANTAQTAAEQAIECLSICTRLGFDASKVDVIEENAAASRAHPTRPGFQSLLSMARQGRITIVAWHLDHLTRAPDDIELLISAAETHGVRIATSSQDVLDLKSGEGRFLARVATAVATHEVETIELPPVNSNVESERWAGESDAR
ncbi:MAG: recombinase family protein [Brevibacterium aurantiacum]|uniref:recombinase family protein n=1 Tax=Brevibacterium aurantiacum TaxID=273384 RepID=UPI003F8E3184